MKIKKKFFGVPFILSFAFKAPDFITSEDVKDYAKVEELPKKLIKIHKKLKHASRRLGVTQIYVRDLTQSEIRFLESKGFTVTIRTRTVKNREVVMMNHYKISI